MLLTEKVDTNKTAMNFMRTAYRLALGLLSIAFAGQPLVAQLNTVTHPPATNDWAVVEMQANSQVWQRIPLETGPGGALFPRTHRYVRMEETPRWPVGAPGKGIVNERRTMQRL